MDNSKFSNKIYKDIITISNQGYFVSKTNKEISFNNKKDIDDLVLYLKSSWELDDPYAVYDTYIGEYCECYSKFEDNIDIAYKKDDDTCVFVGLYSDNIPDKSIGLRLSIDSNSTIRSSDIIKIIKEDSI